MKKSKLFLAISGATLALSSLPLSAQEVLEEIVVTGSYIRGTPEDAASPVDVTTAEDLAEVGSPSTIELVRNLNFNW